MKFDAFSLN